ncbi:MAG TPA: hypothetical protein VGP07_05980 [Polyangia bacterium]
MVERWDETWHRLREWTSGQGPSERLAAQILLAEGFTDVDPSHPLGGRDGGKDALCRRDGIKWAMAVYFPRGQHAFSAIKAKVFADMAGAKENDAAGIAFVTNQELTLSQREELTDGAGDFKVELFHIERVTAILDQPRMANVRKQFLSLEVATASVEDKWVGIEYLAKSGLEEKLHAEGYRLNWVDAEHESERVEFEGWEYVEVTKPDATRTHLKIRDGGAGGGYLVLLKTKESA